MMIIYFNVFINNRILLIFSDLNLDENELK